MPQPSNVLPFRSTRSKRNALEACPQCSTFTRRCTDSLVETHEVFHALSVLCLKRPDQVASVVTLVKNLARAARDD